MPTGTTGSLLDELDKSILTFKSFLYNTYFTTRHHFLDALERVHDGNNQLAKGNTQVCVQLYLYSSMSGVHKKDCILSQEG